MYGRMHATSGALVCAALTLIAVPGFAHARQRSSAELLRAIDRLGVVGNVLYVAAHPDDENTRLLAWLANDKLVRAGYLSLTRGEGGQNLIGAEQAPLLGLIRTEELLAARGVDGAEQWFGRARDFGFSKTPEETLKIWGHDAILSDVVWVIRRFRPDVIVTRFPPGGRNTHGHHTASADLALEAFAAAGDPTRFPEQLRWVTPWQPRRILWNRFSFGPTRPEDVAGFVKLDVGGYDPVLGESYGELAARSRSMHKSQGFGVAAHRGEALEYFKVLAGAPASRSIFDGVDLTWARVPGGQKLAEHLARIRADFSVEAPWRSVPALVALYGEMEALPAHAWKAEKLAELADVIVGCAGLWTDATVADHVAVPGGAVAVTLHALARSPAPVTLRALRLPDGERIAIDHPLAAGQPFSLTRTMKLPADTPYTEPYWLAEPPDAGHWNVRDQLLVGRPAAPPLAAELVVAFGDRALTLTRPLVYAWTDPVAGEERRALEVLPPVSVSPRASLLMVATAAPEALVVRLKAHRDGVHGTLAPSLPEGWSATPASHPFTLARAGDEAEVTFHVRPPLADGRATLRLVATVDGQTYARAVERVAYPHIPIQTLTPPAEVTLVRADIKHHRTRIGYIPGAGDEVPAALRQVGYDVTILSNEALAHQPLDRYQAIVTGVRAFNVDPRLPFVHDRLMRYVADGGTLVVQYNTNNHLSTLPDRIGPAPLHVSQARVTDENAAVGLVAPAHPILTRPNRIGPRDFAGWVQERGLYFADHWDPAYEPILTLHDAGEPPQQGSLLVARHGKGAFIYTGLSFFRQLPAGVPGAYRLFANLLDYAP